MRTTLSILVVTLTLLLATSEGTAKRALPPSLANVLLKQDTLNGVATNLRNVCPQFRPKLANIVSSRVIAVDLPRGFWQEEWIIKACGHHYQALIDFQSTEPTMPGTDFRIRLNFEPIK